MLLTIGNTSMNTDDNMDKLAQIHREFVAAAIAETEMFRETAKKCSDMDNLWQLFERGCGIVQTHGAQQACRTLFDMKIFDISNPVFLKKYRTLYMDVDSYIVPIVDALTGIMEMDQAYHDRKAIEKANRGHWEGGGFGVAGAIKGVVTASAMNLAGSAVHGVLDFASSTMQSAKVSSKKSKIFKDPQTIYVLSIALLKAYIGGFHGVCDELYNHGFSSENEVKPDNAVALSQNAIQYSSDKKQEAELLAKSIFMNPFDVYLYAQFLQRHPKKQGFQNVQKHFGIDRLLDYQITLQNEAETKKIMMQPAYSLEEKCEQIADLTRLAEGTDVQIGHEKYQGYVDKPYITIPAHRPDLAWSVLIQSFEFIVRYLYMGNISDSHIANKQAMCGKPLGISKLLLSDDIGKEKRKILWNVKDQQTGSGKCLDRCPQCFAKLNPIDKYCPDCGRKIKENTV